MTSVTTVLGALLLGGLMGMVGQAIRAIAGLKKMNDSSDTFVASRLAVSLMIGFVAGVIAAVTVGLGKLVQIDLSNLQVLFGIAGAGYAGTDFIEAFAPNIVGAAPGATQPAADPQPQDQPKTQPPKQPRQQFEAMTLNLKGGALTAAGQPQPGGGTPDPVQVIQQQAAQLGTVANLLDNLSDTAHYNGDDDQAIQLQNQASAALIAQSKLFDVEETIVTTSKEWTDFVTSMTAVNASIKQALTDLTALVNVISAVGQMLALADTLIKI